MEPSNQPDQTSQVTVEKASNGFIARVSAPRTQHPTPHDQNWPQVHVFGTLAELTTFMSDLFDTPVQG